MLTKLFAALLTGVLSIGLLAPQLLPPEPAAAPESAFRAAQTNPTEELTAEQAKDIALAHAGLTADQVTRLQVKKDRDDGIWIYEVEFHHGWLEYDYDIHAQTGNILSWDKDD